MGRLRPAQKPVPAGIESGVYLTDGQRLYRVLEVLDQHVELEDCGAPQGMAQWLPLDELLRTMTLVRPDP